MRRSLFARLVVLSLAVAVAAIAATAWLATRTTSDRLVGEFTRSLEADAFVYTQLLDHATAQDDWAEVEPLVRSLSQRTGRRIVITSPSGDVLADSARRPDGSSPGLPAVAAALIDPFAPLQGVAGVQEPTPDLSPGMIAVETTSVTIPAIHAEREAATQQVVACLAEAGITATTSDVRDYVNAGLLEDDGPSAADLEGCDANDRLLALTPTEQLLTEQLTVVFQDCLRDTTGTYTIGPDGTLGLVVRATGGDGGFVVLSPVDRDLLAGSGRPLDPNGDPFPTDTPSPDTAEREQARQCVEQGYREVFGPYVADPALLYLETPAEDGLLAAAGGGRLVGAIGGVLAVVIGVTLLAGRRLVAPIRALTGAAQRMEEGARDARVDVRGHDDVAHLAAAFNSMAASLERNESQRRAMVSDIAHELRSPLTRLRGYLEGAQDGIVNLDEGLVSSLLEESVLVQRLVEDLQELALADAGRLRVAPEDIDLADLAGQVVTTHQPGAAAAGVELELTVDEPAGLRADPGRLRQALGNLVTNALAYTPSGGRVEVSVGAGPRPGTLAIAVTDTGIGIAAEHLPHVFDRFYRADPSRSRATGGTGLGLAITRSLVEAHGGTVEVASTPGQGSRFTIVLPREAR